MLLVNAQGAVMDPRIVNSISPTLEHGSMASAKGIIVHQTGGPTAQSALDGYKRSGANGAHFLIDLDGAIYQTASVYKQTWHIGKLKSRCMMEATCCAGRAETEQALQPEEGERAGTQEIGAGSVPCERGQHRYRVGWRGTAPRAVRARRKESL